MSAVSSATSALEQVQKDYVAALEAQGPASGAGASVVIANSRAEFAARKDVLAIELELLRIRGMEQAEALGNLRDTIQM